MVTSWILNSLSKEIADSVEYANDAVELWKELEDRYEQTNGARLYQIQMEINDLYQGTLDITAYYTKLKKLWEELTTLNKRTQCSCDCNCGAKKSMYIAEQDRRLIQFLMGLNEVYTVVRDIILMMNPLPSLAQTFSLLVQDEKQREIRPTNQLSIESTSLYVSASGQGSFKTNFPANNNYNRNPRARLICDFCKKSGHSKESCYKLHGYPQNGQNSGQNFTPRYFPNGQNHGQNSRYNKGKRVVASVQLASNEALITKENENITQDDGRNFHVGNGDAGRSLGSSNSSNVNAVNFAPSVKRPLQIGRVRDGLYLLCSKCLRKNNSFTAVSDHCCDNLSLSTVNTSSLNVDISYSVSNSCVYKDNNVNLLWHNRLGHVPFVKMKDWGSYHEHTHDKYRYFITIVDDYSRTTWTMLLACKSNALQAIKAFISLVENQFKTNIKSIRSDNGLEFNNLEATVFFQSKGIVHQRTCPYTPQQNEVAERKHRYLLETARALLFQSKLPLKY
ncbi:uncharacterized protein LOC142173749 [Nicotiana tabacum]|uniref:Uncharacterized protein LOC142173749 n=1 Tax=Nicotiana tabacum TaxID=4097 RepID=A0AC58TE71_TOBAC